MADPMPQRTRWPNGWPRSAPAIPTAEPDDGGRGGARGARHHERRSDCAGDLAAGRGGGARPHHRHRQGGDRRTAVDDITDSHIPFGTDELDAIVAHTAIGHQCHPESCETLDDVAGSTERRARRRKLQDATTRIYEACSFQDITGQRITKVVGTLKAIEAKGGADRRGVRRRLPRAQEPLDRASRRRRRC